MRIFMKIFQLPFHVTKYNLGVSLDYLVGDKSSTMYICPCMSKSLWDPEKCIEIPIESNKLSNYKDQNAGLSRQADPQYR